MIKNRQLYKYIWILFLATILASAIYLISVHREYKGDQFIFDDESIEEWNDNWEVNYDGVIEENVTLPVKVPVKRGEAVILRKNLPDKIKKYNSIMIAGKRQDIIVSIGGIQRAAFTNEGHRPFENTPPSGIIIVPLYNTDSQSDVAIRIISDSDYAGDIGRIYIGNEKSLLFKVVKTNVGWTFLDVIVLIIGLLCAYSFATHEATFRISAAMLHLSFFAILSSIWSFTQSGLRQIFISDISTYETFGYCCYMLIPITVLMYVNWIMEKRREKLIAGALVVVMLNFAIENLLQGLHKATFFEMRNVSQIIYALVIIFIFCLCVAEIKREFNAMTKALLVGILGLVIGLLHSLYLDGNRVQWGVYDRYISGALIFLISGFVYTSMCVQKEEKLRKDAESANRAKSIFLATMSHEIKTPINVVMGMNELIMRDTFDEGVMEYAKNINAAGNSLLAMVNDLLDFSKIESGRMDIVCVDYQLKSLLHDVAVMTKMRINDKDVKLVLDIDESIPSIYYGDEVRIKQVLSNLLANAAKYTDKGSITFSVKQRSINDDRIELYFSIKDTGTGIKEEDISKYMDSFVRLEKEVNSSTSGTGLGLAITSRVLELMDSKLEVDSVYGEGSDFHFILKQQVVDSKRMGQVLEQSDNGEEKKKGITFTAPNARVLVVDDTKINIKVVCGLLKPTSIQVDTCESGKACLELCKENSYDVILMDHMMPEMDGIEAFKAIRADKTLKSTNSKIVVLTANTVSGAAEMYKEVGFDYYMKKPVDVNELNRVLMSFIPEELIER